MEGMVDTVDIRVTVGHLSCLINLLLGPDGGDGGHGGH